jgi:hypothetical protein
MSTVKQKQQSPKVLLKEEAENKLLNDDDHEASSYEEIKIE